MNKIIKSALLSLLFALTLGSASLIARPVEAPKSDDKSQSESTLRTATGIFDLQKNTVSNFSMYVTNYGIWGHNVSSSLGGGWWPRGTQNQYVYGAGIWLGVQKKITYQSNGKDTSSYVKLTAYSYNPSDGRSIFTPGTVAEFGDKSARLSTTKYRTFLSTDFNKMTGLPLKSADGSAWPIWDTEENLVLKHDRYFGHYVMDENLRKNSSYPKGPAMISGEDIFSVYNDLDLSVYPEGSSRAKTEGYPLQLQVEQTIYSWGYGLYKNFIFIKYELQNLSPDSLKECWMATVLDPDIQYSTYTSGAANDFAMMYPNKSLNLGVQWSDVDKGENNRGFGYFGLDFLESPAVNALRDLRHDKKVYSNSEQIGLKTFEAYEIDNEPKSAGNRYNLISKNTLQLKPKSATKGSDVRLVMATGPFNFAPNDTARCVVGVLFAYPYKSYNPKYTPNDTLDMYNMYALDTFAQKVYDDNFLAPAPPSTSTLTEVKPLDHAVRIKWDNAAELSVDTNEHGLDFLGYRLQRARRNNLDTCDEATIAATTDYPQGKGPFGWKTIANYQINYPYFKTDVTFGDSKSWKMSHHDDFILVAQKQYSIVDNKATGKSETLWNWFDVIRMPLGCTTWPSYWTKNKAPDIDTGSIFNPWNTYFTDLYNYSPTLYKKAITGHIIVSPNIRNLANYNNTDGGKFFSGIDSVECLYQRRSAHDIILDLVKNGDATITWDGDIFDDKDLAEFNGKKIREDYIVPYMTRITDNRTFVDVGDDNGDGTISEDTDPTKTEKLYNNVEYYYRIIGYDEGDYIQSITSKEESPSKGMPSYAEVMPQGGAVSENPTITITHIDTLKIGGLSNFNLSVNDYARFNQLFAGHEFKLEFNPTAYHSTAVGTQDTTIFSVYLDTAIKGQDTVIIVPPRLKDTTLVHDMTFLPYSRAITLTDITTNTILYVGNTRFEEGACYYTYIGAFTEDAASWVRAYLPVPDSISGIPITFGLPYSRETEKSSGTFSTENSCYHTQDMDMIGAITGSLGGGFKGDAKNLFNFSFDYTLEQQGGRYRMDSLKTSKPAEVATAVRYPTVALQYDVNQTKFQYVQGKDTIVCQRKYEVPFFYTMDSLSKYIMRSQYYEYNKYYGFNNGPADYEITFKDGGTENTRELIKIPVGKTGYKIDSADFVLNYLTVDVKNKTKFSKYDRTKGDSVACSYIENVEPYVYPFGDLTRVGGINAAQKYPYLSALKSSDEYFGKYNLTAYGFINNNDSAIFVADKYDSLTVKYFHNGTQNRYYTGGYRVSDPNQKIYFVHTMLLSGVPMILDHANYDYTLNSRNFAIGDGFKLLKKDANIQRDGQDFKAGDVLKLGTFGGTLGLPLPGASVTFKANDTRASATGWSDNKMDQIRIVPNPYYVTHQAQLSPYDAKIFFTRLPEQCKIEIYNVSGQKVKTINHDEKTGSEVSVDTWDLLSENNMRVASQVFVAYITETTTGAQTIQQFSVIVGPYRLQSDE